MNRFPKFILKYFICFFKLLTLFTYFFILNFSLAKPITLSLSGGTLFSKVSSNTGFSGSFGFTYPFFPDLDINANIDYLNLNPHSGFATDLTLG